MIGGIVGAAAGAASSLLGSFGRNAALKRQIRDLSARKDANQDWYDQRYNEDATQKADAQRMLAMTEEAIRNRNRQAAGTAAVMGGTEESVAATKAANAQALADTASQIAVAGDQRKAQVESQYMARNDALDDQIGTLKGQKQNWADMAGNAIGGAAEGFKAGFGLLDK